MGWDSCEEQERSMRLMRVVRPAVFQSFLAAVALSMFLSAGVNRALGQSGSTTPVDQSSQPQVTKSPQGKADEAARAAARASARHFERVVIIVLENADF